jgi:hypothetical protein
MSVSAARQRFPAADPSLAKSTPRRHHWRSRVAGRCPIRRLLEPALRWKYEIYEIFKAPDRPVRGPRFNTIVSQLCCGVMAGHSASKMRVKRAFDPAIHPGMDPPVKSAGDGQSFLRRCAFTQLTRQSHPPLHKKLQQTQRRRGPQGPTPTAVVIGAMIEPGAAPASLTPRFSRPPTDIESGLNQSVGRRFPGGSVT